MNAATQCRAHSESNLKGFRDPAAPSPPANPETHPAAPASPCMSEPTSTERWQSIVHTLHRSSCAARGVPCIRLWHTKCRCHNAFAKFAVADEEVHIPAGSQRRGQGRIRRSCFRQAHVTSINGGTKSVYVTHEAANRVPGSRGIAPFAFMMPALSSCWCNRLQLRSATGRPCVAVLQPVALSH
jgi:hypothetical protein